MSSIRIKLIRQLNQKQPARFCQFWFSHVCINPGLACLPLLFSQIAQLRQNIPQLAKPANSKQPGIDQTNSPIKV